MIMALILERVGVERGDLAGEFQRILRGGLGGEQPDVELANLGIALLLRRGGAGLLIGDRIGEHRLDVFREPVGDLVHLLVCERSRSDGVCAVGMAGITRRAITSARRVSRYSLIFSTPS